MKPVKELYVQKILLEVQSSENTQDRLCKKFNFFLLFYNQNVILTLSLLSVQITDSPITDFYSNFSKARMSVSFFPCLSHAVKQCFSLL